MRILTVLSVGFLAAEGRAAPVSPPPAPAPGPAVLTYSAALDLEYRDVFGKPDSAAGGPTAPSPTSPNPQPAALRLKATPRSLGLKRLRLSLDWRTQNASGLHLVLRPDALSREAPGATRAVETDTRSGDPYRPMPTIKLLDAYHVTIYPASSLSTSVGVFEELAPLRASYPVALDFGLRVALPAKFAGLRLRWQDARDGPDLPTARVAGALLADVYAIDGDEDRVETSGSKRGSFDTAPVASDPYLGGAAVLSFLPTDSIELSAAGGLLDSRAGDPTRGEGKRSNGFGQVTAVAQLFAQGGFPTTLSLDLRASAEKWRGMQSGLAKPAPRVQRSAGLSASTRVLPQAWVLLGTQLGKSQRASTAAHPDLSATVNGWQVEAGILGSLGSDLSLQLMISAERRLIDGPGTDGGAFIDADGGAHATLRRYGLVLSYDLNEKA